MDLSTRLSYLFGSEIYVSMRRQLVFWREMLWNHQYEHHKYGQRVICSGSLGEGVAYPKSDDDMMYYSTQLRVVKTRREVTNWGDILMVPSEFSPGYCLLFQVPCSDNDINIMDGMSRLLFSSSLPHLILMSEEQHIHGPCQSGRIGTNEYDLAFSIPCPTWPDIANSWIIRNRLNDWPSCELIQNIIQNGCHVVPVGDPDSPDGQHEWRISFSVAERALMHSFNHAQFLVYNLLRLTLKRIIEKVFPEVLVSYFMKTTLFYTSENTCMELWQEDNLETCFKTCLSVLYDYVDQVYCPNYFIPEYNMIKRKIKQTNRQQILHIIRYVHRMGIIGVLHLSGESNCLNESLSTGMVEYKLDRELLFSHHLDAVLIHTKVFFEVMHYKHMPHCLHLLQDFWRFLQDSSVIGTDLKKIIFNNEIINSCQNMMNRLSNYNTQNKRYYRDLYKQLKLLLKLGFNVNVTTGKLTMATFLYIVGKIPAALIIIRQLLSDYPPYAIETSSDDIKRTTYIDVMCGKGYTIDYKIKRSFAPQYVLYGNSLNTCPYPLRIWTSMLEYLNLYPLTYTFILQSLCYLQQRNQEFLKKSIRFLINSINDLEYEKNVIDARMCVGIIKFVQGDSQSACRWLGSAYFMKNTIPPPIDKGYSLSVLTYISCLLNRQFQSDFLWNRFP